MNRHLATLLATSALLLALSTAGADDDRLPMPTPPPAYAQECGSCHLAYPPGLLPAPAWDNIMRRLDDHYGTDASLDAATAGVLQAWLRRHAGTGKHARHPPTDDRITQYDWFRRKHRDIPAAVWSHDAVGSAANCAACHRNAVRGDFEDEGLVFPAGLDRRYQPAWRDN